MATLGCHEATTVPIGSMLLVGAFGAEGAELRADSSHATLEQACLEVTTDVPIRTNADGRFTLPALRHRTGGAFIAGFPEEPTPVTIDGGATDGSVRRVTLMVVTKPASPGAPVPPADTFNLAEAVHAVILGCP
ncbi:MAG: hypothetical protein ACHQQ3_03945 [Gemmatimonadales bacterium]